MAHLLDQKRASNKALQVTGLNVTALARQGPCHLKRPVPELGSLGEKALRMEHAVLKKFLLKALGEKRERLIGFLSKPKNHHKYFELLSHELGDYFLHSVQVPDLPSKAWTGPAISFVGPKGVVTNHDSMSEAWGQVDKYQGALVISKDGNFGVWCDHEQWDEEIFVSIE